MSSVLAEGERTDQLSFIKLNTFNHINSLIDVGMTFCFLVIAALTTLSCQPWTIERCFLRGKFMVFATGFLNQIHFDRITSDFSNSVWMRIVGVGKDTRTGKWAVNDSTIVPSPSRSRYSIYWMVLFFERSQKIAVKY